MPISTSTPITEAENGGGTTLRTARLLLRPLAEADLAAIVALANDPAVAEKTARMPYPYGLGDARAWFDALQDRQTGAAELVFAIVRRADDELIGAIGLVLPRRGTTAEIGYWLGRPYWNKGYMTEAVSRVLRHAFEMLGLDAVQGGAFPDNAASLRVQEKAGMRRIGRTMRPAPARGGAREVVLMEIRRVDWPR